VPSAVSHSELPFSTATILSAAIANNAFDRVEAFAIDA
jgi:hypothetical protein